MAVAVTLEDWSVVDDWGSEGLVRSGTWFGALVMFLCGLGEDREVWEGGPCDSAAV